MPSYVFEDMTAAQSAAFDGATDTLTFSTVATNAGDLTVSYQTIIAPSSGTSAGDATTTGVVLADASGHALTFGPAIEAHPISAISFAGPSGALNVGSGGADAPGGFGLAGSFVYGGAGADTLQIDGANSLLQGNLGDDSLTASPTAANATLYGGQGKDVINVNGGASLVNGNLGDDVITGHANDTLYGGQGDDRITTGSGANLVNGNLGNDTIVTNGGADTLYGGQDDDLFLTTGANDVINGNQGNDTVRHTDAGSPLVHGGQGDDYISVFSTQGSQIFGDLGNDTIMSVTGNSTLVGGDGNDSLQASSNQHGTSYSIDAGAGANAIFVTNGATGGNGDTITGGDGGNTITLTPNDAGKNLIMTGAGHDSITIVTAGTVTGDDTINAGGGDNFITVSQDMASSLITTGAGDDTIIGGHGNDTIFSGDGNDEIHVNGGQVSHVTVGAGHVHIFAGGGQEFITKASAGVAVFTLNGASDPTAGRQDQISGWNGATDHIDFDGLARTVLIDSAPHAPVVDYSTAVAEANFQFTQGYNLVALQVGGDVVLFASNTAVQIADQAILLVGGSLADVHASNIIG